MAKECGPCCPLFEVFDFPIDSYGLANVLAYGLAAWIAYTLAVRDGRDKRDAFDFLLVSVISALFGAKIFHTLFEAEGHELSDGSEANGVLDLLLDDPLHWADLFAPGYVFYGGVVISSLTTLIFLHRRQFARPVALPITPPRLWPSAWASGVWVVSWRAVVTARQPIYLGR